jgi:hypothetical protein
MRIKHRYLTWDSHLKVINPVMKILDKYSNDYKYKEDLNCVIPTFKYQIEFYIYEDYPEFDKIKKDLCKYLEPQVIGTEYEKKDLKNAEWFVISTGEYQYPQPENDFGYLKATFNLDNYCKHCGIGKVQNAPYRLKTEPKQLNNQFWGLHWDFDAVFVRHEAKNILERENIKSIRFTNPVLHKKDSPIQDFYQLHIETRLDNGFDSYNTEKITCKFNNEEHCNNDKTQDYCNRIKYHHPMIGGYCFDKTIFDSKFDIVETNEYFGSGASANRLQIVSKRFKEIVEKNKLKGLVFTPIVHERYKHE